MRLLSIAVCLATALALPAGAMSLPDGGSLRFDVLRKGKDIGDHSYRFSGNGVAFTVTVDTDVAVKVPLIRTKVYSFEHRSVENWKGGKLSKISSATNDNGEPYKLQTKGNGTLPASLWNEDIVRAKKLINTIDGKMMSVRVSDLGTEAVRVGGGTVNARHYRLSGDLARDLWYDDKGNLARVVFKADDGSTVTYVRK